MNVSLNDLLLSLDKIKGKNFEIKKVPSTRPLKTKNKNLEGTDYFIKKSKKVLKVTIGTEKNKARVVTLYASNMNEAVTFIIDPTKLDKTLSKQLLNNLGKMFDKITVAQWDHVIKNKKVEKVSEEALDKINLNEDSASVYFQLSLVGIAVGVFFFLYNISKAMYYRQVESQAASTLEKRMNEELFKGQSGNEPEFVVFKDLINSVNRVLDKKIPALIIAGPPGQSKTYMVRRTLHFKGLVPGKDYTMMKGASLGLYEFLQAVYDYRNKILILDDFDSPLKNPDMLNVLKAITDSYSIRIVTVPQERERAAAGSMQPPTSGGADMPRKFEFKGQVIIITNILKKNIDPALMSRAPVIEINFDQRKMLNIIQKMLKFIYPQIDMKIKQEVFEYLASLRKRNKTIRIDFRTFLNAVGIRTTMPQEWKTLVRAMIGVHSK